MDVSEVRDDLIAEQDELDRVVSSLSEEQWQLATPSAGWTVADQIGHLTYFDDTAALAITDPDAFTAGVSELLETFGDADDPTLRASRALTSAELLAAWRNNRHRLAQVTLDLADDARIVWYGPSMGSKSFLTARLMEAWAHGQDIVDAVGATRPPTDRLRHIAQLGFITRRWSYVNRGQVSPEVAVRVELEAPSGATWTFGPDEAAEFVAGSAEDFCLVVTQRRHVDDTSLEVHGAAARDWMERAQAFAGAPTDGPAPTARPTPTTPTTPTTPKF
jgi:uncharacterized protein (TIGR03084 family)